MIITKMHSALEIPVIKGVTLYAAVDLDLSHDEGTAGSLLGPAIEFVGVSNCFSFLVEDQKGDIIQIESFATKTSHDKIHKLIEDYCVDNWDEVLQDNYQIIRK